MGVPYEGGSQKNVGWIAEKFRSIDARFEEAARAARTRARGNGVVVPQAAGQTLAQALGLTSGATLGTNSTLTRVNGYVDLHLEILCGTAVGTSAVLLTLPAGFRPFVLGSGTDWRFGGSAYTTSWVSATYYCSVADATIRPLSTAIPANGWADVHLGFRAAS